MKQMGIGTMLREAIERSGQPTKVWARECSYSVDSLYAACQEKRSIPIDARQKISGIHALAGLAIALEGTNYAQWFEPPQGDRHPLAMIVRNLKESSEATEVVRQLPTRVLDKFSAADLSAEDNELIEQAKKEVSERVRADLYLLVELDDLYNTGLTEYLTNKKRAV